MASIGLSVDTSAFKGLESDLKKATVRVMDKSGPEWIKKHIERTKQGLNNKDQQMEKLSKKYGEKVGRTRRTLYETGNLFKRIVAKSARIVGSAVSLIIGIFGGKEERIAQEQQDKHDWWGNSPMLDRHMQQFQQREMDKEIEAMNRK